MCVCVVFVCLALSFPVLNLSPGVNSSLKKIEVSKEILIHTLKAQSLNNFLSWLLVTAALSTHLASLKGLD